MKQIHQTPADLLKIIERSKQLRAEAEKLRDVSDRLNAQVREMDWASAELRRWRESAWGSKRFGG